MPNLMWEKTANELRDRIVALIPTNPHILEMKDPFDLFEVYGFRCDDLSPTNVQASWALRNAQKQFVKESQRE